MDNAKDIKSKLYKNIIDADPTGDNADEILKAASDQWHDEGTRDVAERDFPKPILDAAKKLYPQESQKSLVNKLPKTPEELFVPHKDNPMFMGMGDKPEEAVKYIAEQAQNMNGDKPVIPENPQAYEQMVSSLGGDKELVDAAIAKYPKPKVTEGSSVVEDINKHKIENNAIQEQSTGSVLQRQQEAVGEKGGERERVEPIKQGDETAGTQPKENGSKKEESTGTGTGNEGSPTEAEVAAQKLEAERDAKISDIQKPEPKLEFLTSQDLVGSDDPLGNKAKHDEIKNNFKELRKLIDCLWG
jgi:hypothetical protein